MDRKFVVTPKTERSVTVTVRIEMETYQRLEELVTKSGRSRNELINKAIKFALDNLEFTE
ncbi:MAG TPA: CopG family transcriptional regulator [Candidatus Ornithomonoglobus merdipullorum]|uniref:CopG family transcriptional regulator n=1 Tax=Candidatus Ornithomonoglobus merdipullorum TaxID=2840895 RepID=A0A9D1SG69_9FIRM|nr:CopG family transcriptional regulator [Candidatus Ornithomonoglobus merdipullorum]